MGIAPLYKRPIRRTITLGDYSPGGRRISAAVVVSGVTLDAPQADGLSHMDKPATGSQPCAVPLLDDAVDHVLPEHPGWRMSSSRMVRVVDCPDGSRWLLEAQAKTVTATRLHGSGPPPPVDVFTLDGIPAHRPDQAALFSRLKQLGVVARVRTCSVWEAVATAIVRQVSGWSWPNACVGGSATPSGNTSRCLMAASTPCSLHRSGSCGYGMRISAPPG